MTDTIQYNQDQDLQNQFVEFTEFYKKVGGIQFSLLKNQEIIDISTIPIKDYVLYNQKDHSINDFGPLDLRLGVGDKKHTCNTCKKRIEDCSGHYGYVKLALPIYHVGYFKHTLNMLQCICKQCSRVLLGPTERDLFLMRMKRRGLDRLVKNAIFKKILAECKKTKFCAYCGGYNGTVKKMPGKACKIVHVYVKKGQEDDTEFPEEVQNSLKGNPALEEALIKRKQEEINPLMAFQMLSRVKEEDAYLFNIDPKQVKPVDFLVTHVLVPPVCIRPMVQVAPGLTNEDDLTIKILEIIKCNNSIAKAIKDGIELPKIYEAWYQMESHYAHYINSATPGLSPELIGKKANIRALCQRLKGKNGRFRGNLSGKRVNFSGRTVISPDPNISIDQVIVPQHMAKVLTYPERVNKINLAKMRKLVQNGPENYPGANYLEFADGSGKINLMFGNRKLRAENLKIGDIVERHLYDGDIVLFNRQPSLHRLSIMAHRAKVLPWRTLRFNECVCTPYNADFDGDEMNIHVPQTEEARTEALYLMGVHQNLLTPKNGEPIIALTQDFLTTSYLLTQKDRFFDRAAFSQICSYLFNANEHIDLPPPTILKPVELWTGKQIINMILCPNKKNRILVNVNIKEKNYSGSGEFACLKDGWVIFHNSELICGSLGKSVLGSGTKGGLFYSIIKDNSREQAAKCMNKFAKLSARWLTNYGMTFGITDVTPSPSLITSNEETMERAYKVCDEKIAMYKAGTLPLMAGCTAEQTLENVLNGILSQVRDDVGTVCRKKLPPHNSPLIMAICGSKGSNINLSQMIACVGQQTLGGQRIPYGFTNRTLPHFEKNSRHPAAKGFVKNSFFDGLSGPEFLFHTMGGREGLIDTAVKTADTGYMQRRLMKALEDLSVSYDYSVRTSDGYVVQFMYGEDAMDPMMMEDQNKPLNFERLWNFVKGMYPYRRGIERTLYPYEIEEILNIKGSSSEVINMEIVSGRFKEDLRNYINKIITDLIDLRERHGLPRGENQEQITGTMNIEEADGTNLSIQQEIVDNILNVTKRQLEAFFDRVWERYTKAMITPGEAVGAVTAQSIGEPGTQMTLKTFHFAGVASMNVTMGVPRIKEIINASNIISTPIITAKLINDTDPISARIVKGRIEKTLLGDVCKYIKEVYSPEGCYLSFKLDVEAIEALKLDINLNMIKECIIKTPRLKIKDQHISFVGSDKFRVEPHDYSSNSLYFVLQQLKKKLPQVIIKGIPSINRAVISKKDLSDGSCKYNLAVEGYGLRAVMNIPGIDGKHTTTNHIMETEKVLGIEAARRSIAAEISNLMKNHSMTVDERHFGLLADIMTYKGVVLGITRFGITKMKDSTLTLASFEKTTDILFDSAIIARDENVLGVSDCIILGDAMKIGTGTFKVMYDAKKEVVQKTKGKSLSRMLGEVKLLPILEE